LLDRVMVLLEVAHGGPQGYSLQAHDDPAYLPGRCARVMVAGSPVGTLGTLHPDTLKQFQLDMPCSALELDIEPFL